MEMAIRVCLMSGDLSFPKKEDVVDVVCNASFNAMNVHPI